MKVSALEATKSLMEVLAGEIFRQDGLSRALREIVRIGRELVRADLAVIFAVNPVTGGFLSVPVVSGDLRAADLEGLLEPRPEGLTRQVMEKRSIFVDDLASPQWQSFASGFTRAVGVRHGHPRQRSTESLPPLLFDEREHRIRPLERTLLRQGHRR